MCGISGWYAWGDARPKVNTIKGLLMANMERGTSATGAAWLENGEIIIRKGKGPASAFIEHTSDEIFEQMALSPRGLLHARATTKGSEDVNDNNHPVNGLGWLTVHNGTIGNDDDLWGYYTEKDGVTRFADVDTSAIPLMLSRGNSIAESIKKLSVLSGSATFAAWSETDKDHILLARFGHNDLHMFYDAVGDILYWSSAPSAGYVMRGRVMGKHKFLNMTRLADQHAMVIGPEGMDATRVFKVTQSAFFAARKWAAPDRSPRHEPQPKPAGNLGPGGTLPVVTRPALVIVPPSSVSSAELLATSVPPGTLGWTEILRKDKQSELQHTKDGGLSVAFAIKGEHMVRALWQPIEQEKNKPLPMTSEFTRIWWNLPDMFKLLHEPSAVVTEIKKETSYGHWRIGYDKKKESDYMGFKPHKRIKAWWDRMYRTNFTFPEEVDGKGNTGLDDHMAWEHYDVHLQRNDRSSHAFLGWMCPWCGVWLSATRVQAMKFRCEFCCIRSRIATVWEGQRG